MSDLESVGVAVIGAGPVGLAAAAHLAERGLDFVVLEAGDSPASAIGEWGHVRLFSPWRFDTDSAARRLLGADGWQAPDPDGLPTGADLIDDYLAPLAKRLDGRVRYGARVEAVTRLGFDRVRSAGREESPFLVRLDGGDELIASAVIDASGTWRTPNVLGANGIPARGEQDAGDAVVHSLPDVLGSDRDRFAGRRTVVVGTGHSASTTLLGLAELAAGEPGTEVVWAIRTVSPRRAYGGGEADELPARGALGTLLRKQVEAGRIQVVTGFGIRTVGRDAGGVAVTSGDGRTLTADLVVNATGFRPDHTIASELRLDLDPILGSTRALAPLIDPNKHSCGTVPPHGVDELAHPETGYYALGVKSYGRAPTFLLATGYEQARSVVAAIAGDWAAARDVQLELPETGVCSSSLVDGDAEVTGGCCGPAATDSQPDKRGLATGVSGGLLTIPLVDVAAGQGGCCK
jgi:hypothetical protein